MISTVNKATRITGHFATTIHHIHTNSDISDHIPVFFTTKYQIDVDDENQQSTFSASFLFGNCQREV